jgi:hypothetical protein
VLRQFDQGCHLLAAWLDDTVVGAAGYRMQENLVHGRFCYVDDLVAAERARTDRCTRLTQDTEPTNLLGQRFYFRYGMLPASLCFFLPLD